MEDPLWMFDEQHAPRHEIVFPLEMDPDELSRAVAALADQAIMPLGFTVELRRKGPRAHVWAADPAGAVEALEAAGFPAKTVGRPRDHGRTRTADRTGERLGRSR